MVWSFQVWTVGGQSLPRVTLTEQHASFTHVMEDLQRLTGYGYTIEWDSIQRLKPVSFSLHHVSLSGILDSALGEQPFFYQIIGRMIHIRPGGYVKGVVIDTLGQPIEGATITGPDAQYPVYASSDAQGFFRLRLPQTQMPEIGRAHV